MITDKERAVINQHITMHTTDNVIRVFPRRDAGVLCYRIHGDMSRVRDIQGEIERQVRGGSHLQS